MIGLFFFLKKPLVAVLIDCYLKAFKLRTTWINNNEFINAALKALKSVYKVIWQ